MQRRPPSRRATIAVQSVCSALLAVLACRAQAPTPQAEPVSAPNPVAIIREASYIDPEQAARRQGSVEVVVRSADRPTQALPVSLVGIGANQGDSLRRTADDNGLTRFDAVPVGEHLMVVRRIGYGSARAIVQVKAGCRTDVEVYIPMMAIGLMPPPPMPGRVVITTCR
jgi:hypothetical protein